MRTAAGSVCYVECFFYKGIFYHSYYFIYFFNTASSADATVPGDAGIEPRQELLQLATLALTVRRSNYSARSHPRFNWYQVPNSLARGFVISRRFYVECCCENVTRLNSVLF
jgi:hypothetical protein